MPIPLNNPAVVVIIFTVLCTIGFYATLQWMYWRKQALDTRHVAQEREAILDRVIAGKDHMIDMLIERKLPKEER